MGFGWSLAVDCRGAGNGRMRYLSLWLFAQDLVSRFGPWDGRLSQAEAVRELAHFRLNCSRESSVFSHNRRSLQFPAKPNCCRFKSTIAASLISLPNDTELDNWY
jgi:hypothetical protein